MDIADHAQDLTEREIASSLAQVQAQTIPIFSGHCLSCDEPVVDRRYCDAECRKDHESTMRSHSFS